MMVSADLLRGYTDAVILRQLAGEDGYGYQISKQVANISGGRLGSEITLSPGGLLKAAGAEYADLVLT